MHTMEKDNPLKKKLEYIFRKAITEKIFPGAVISVSKGDGRLLNTSLFTFGYGDYEEKQISRKTFYDIASLTKPLATTLAILALVKEGKISLTTKLGIFYEGIENEKKEIKIWQLLNHCSGMANYRPYYHEITEKNQQAARNKIVSLVLSEPLQTQSGYKQVYSDLGFIVLGDVVEKVSGQPLDIFTEEKIYRPIGLSDTLIFNKRGSRKEKNYAPTEECKWRGKLLNGEVHDDNAYAAGGVLGHAGLFGTLLGVTDLVNVLKDIVLLKKEHPNIDAQLLQKAVRRKNSKGSWGLGFDTPSPKDSSAGKYFSEKSFGHLGFTGTSFWVDTERDLSIVLLTNRVHPDRNNNKMKRFRPLFHDTVMQILLGK